MIAVECLGTGYAEIRQILDRRPQIIRIGPRLISRLPDDDCSRAMLTNLGDLGSSLDAWLLADGVERPAHLRELHALGVPLALGGLIGAATPTPSPCRRTFTGSGAWPPASPGFSPGTRRGAARIADVVQPARITRPSTPASTPALAGTDPPAPSRAPAAARWTVAVDVADVPVTLARCDATGSGPSRPVTLRMPPDLTVQDAAHRAMARPAATRFEPAVCVDATGQILGVVDMTDLILRLAQSVEPPRTAERALSAVRQRTPTAPALR
jgi:hypothetical protein